MCMLRHKSSCGTAGALLLLFLASSCHGPAPETPPLSNTALIANEWSPPGPDTTTSASGEYRFVVTPWERVPGGRREDNPPVGQLAWKSPSGTWEILWTANLVNRVSPMSAVVSNDGAYVVTFDDWGGHGFGPNVVVIYDWKGKLVRNFALTDFVDTGSANYLPQSASSIEWQSEPPIFVATDTLSLFVYKYNESGRTLHPTCDTALIDLRSGQVLSPRAGPGRFVFHGQRSNNPVVMSERTTGRVLLRREDLVFAPVMNMSDSSPYMGIVFPSHDDTQLVDTARTIVGCSINFQESAWLLVIGHSTLAQFQAQNSHGVDIILWDERLPSWGVVACDTGAKHARVEWAADGKYCGVTYRGKIRDHFSLFRRVSADEGYVKKLAEWHTPDNWEIYMRETLSTQWHEDEGYVEIWVFTRDPDDDLKEWVRIDFQVGPE
jgi:hypothetical protein